MTRGMFRGPCLVRRAGRKPSQDTRACSLRPADRAVYCESEQLPEFIHSFVHITGAGSGSTPEPVRPQFISSCPCQRLTFAYTDSLPAPTTLPQAEQVMTSEWPTTRA